MLEKFHILAKEYYENFTVVSGKDAGKIKRFPNQEKLKAAWLERYPNDEFYKLWDEYLETKVYQDYVVDRKKR